MVTYLHETDDSLICLLCPLIAYIYVCYPVLDKDDLQRQWGMLLCMLNDKFQALLQKSATVGIDRVYCVEFNV